MATALSVEGRLESGRREIGCDSARVFIELAKALGVKISHGGYSEAINGKKALDRETGQKLFDVLERMRELQNAVNSAIDPDGNRVGFVIVDWSRTEKVADALAYRLLRRIAGDQIEGLREAADTATKAVS